MSNMICIRGVNIDLDPGVPIPHEVDLEFLLRAVSTIMRFNSQGNSVLAHTLQVAQFLQDKGADQDTIRLGIAHDLHAAIISDVPTPVKRALGKPWYDFEQELEYRLRDRLCLHSGDSKMVRWADEVVTQYEIENNYRTHYWGVESDVLIRHLLWMWHMEDIKAAANSPKWAWEPDMLTDLGEHVNAEICAINPIPVMGCYPDVFDPMTWEVMFRRITQIWGGVLEIHQSPFDGLWRIYWSGSTHGGDISTGVTREEALLKAYQEVM
jgi:hypothetical protein